MSHPLHKPRPGYLPHKKHGNRPPPPTVLAAAGAAPLKPQYGVDPRLELFVPPQQRRARSPAAIKAWRSLLSAVPGLAHSAFGELPARMQPAADEFTVLAAVFAVFDSSYFADNEFTPSVTAPKQSDVNESNHDVPQSFSLVTMSTGTRCLGASLQSRAGLVVEDGHAEVKSRRTLCRLLMHDLAALCLRVRATINAFNNNSNESSTDDASARGTSPTKVVIVRSTFFEWALYPILTTSAADTPVIDAAAPTDTTATEADIPAVTAGVTAPTVTLRPAPRPRLRRGVSFALYVSQPPCGSASYDLPRPNFDPDSQASNSSNINASTGANTDNSNDNAQSSDASASAIIDTTTTTTSAASSSPSSACPLPQLLADSSATDPARLQPKPGRSDLPAALRTRCQSCSDKLARHCALGLQGAWLAAAAASPLTDREREQEQEQAIALTSGCEKGRLWDVRRDLVLPWTAVVVSAGVDPAITLPIVTEVASTESGNAAPDSQSQSDTASTAALNTTLTGYKQSGTWDDASVTQYGTINGLKLAFYDRIRGHFAPESLTNKSQSHAEADEQSQSGLPAPPLPPLLAIAPSVCFPNSRWALLRQAAAEARARQVEAQKEIGRAHV